MKDGKKDRTYKVIVTAIVTAAGLVLGLWLFAHRDHIIPQETNTVSVNILVSLNNNQGNKSRYEEFFQRYHASQSDILVVPFYVISDTHVMLKLIYSKQANQTYDIACMGADQMISLTDLNLVTPMDEYILKSKGLAWLNQIRPVMLADAMKDGKIFSIPFSRSATLLYYNKDQITDIGDCIDLKELLAKADVQYQEHLVPELMAPVNYLLLETVAHQKAYHAKDRFSLSEEDKVEILSQYQKAIQDHIIIKYSENDIVNFDKFIQGDIEMLVASSVYYNDIADKTTFSLGCSPLELYKDVTFPLQGNNFYMVSQPDDSRYAEVWKAVEGLVDYGFTEDNLSIMKQDAQTEPFCHISHYGYNNTSGMAVTQNSKIRLLTESMIINLLKGNETAKELTEQLQMQVDELLKQQPEG